MTDRIALFIDGANLHTTVKSLGFEVDFRRLLVEFGRHGQIVRAYFYTVVRDDDEFSSLRPLVDWLDYNGYAVRRKSAKQHDDGDGRRRMKRSIGIELCSPAMVTCEPSSRPSGGWAYASPSFPAFERNLP
jgi:uncharacterized LabA/DUF88 family protein